MREHRNMFFFIYIKLIVLTYICAYGIMYLTRESVVIKMLDELMNEYARQMSKKIDNDMYVFLEKNGYHLERNNVEQIIKLKNELAKEDKQIRYETTVVAQHLNEPYKIITHGLIFFDSISNPLSDEQVKELILKDYYKKEMI